MRRNERKARSTSDKRAGAENKRERRKARATKRGESSSGHTQNAGLSAVCPPSCNSRCVWSNTRLRITQQQRFALSWTRLDSSVRSSTNVGATLDYFLRSTAAANHTTHASSLSLSHQRGEREGEHLVEVRHICPKRQQTRGERGGVVRGIREIGLTSKE